MIHIRQLVGKPLMDTGPVVEHNVLQNTTEKTSDSTNSCALMSVRQETLLVFIEIISVVYSCAKNSNCDIKSFILILFSLPVYNTSTFSFYFGI